jgi:hypothetical protein
VEIGEEEEANRVEEEGVRIFGSREFGVKMAGFSAPENND